MYRNRRHLAKFRIGWKTPLLLASLALATVACNDGPSDPRPPRSPPRPMLMSGKVMTAQMDFSVRLVQPPPAKKGSGSGTKLA